MVQPAAGEVEPPLVHVRPSAVGPREPHHHGGAVRHPEKALLALTHRSLGLLPRERAGEHGRQQPEPRDQLVGPVVLRAEGAHHEGARDRAAHDERHQDGRACAEAFEGLPIDRRLVGEVPEARESDDVPLAELGHDPRRRVAPDHPAEGRHALSGPGVRGPDLVGRGGERSHGGPVGPQILDQAPETGLDLSVHLRHGAGGEHGGQVGEERLEAQALGDAALDAPAQSTVHEECRDQRALQQEQRGGSHDQPPVALPHGRLLEQDDASGRKAPDVEPPVMELTPVHHHRGGVDVGRVRPLPREDAERQPGARPPVGLEAHHVAAHAPGAHGVVLEHVDGHARGAGNSRDRVTGVEVLARRVTQKGADQDDRVLRQRCDLLRDLPDRAAREVADLDSVAVGRELLACRGQPGEIGGCRPRHHDGPAGIGLEAPRELQRLGPVLPQPGARDVGAEPEVGDAGPVHTEEDEGGSREQLRAVVVGHAERAAPRGHDQVDAVWLVLPAQERPQLALRRVAVEEGEVQVLGVEVDGKGGLRLEGRAERFVDADDRRRESRIGVEQQDVPGWAPAISLGVAWPRRESRRHDGQDGQKEGQTSHGPRGENSVPSTAVEARFRHALLLPASLRKYTSGPHAHKGPWTKVQSPGRPTTLARVPVPSCLSWSVEPARSRGRRSGWGRAIRPGASPVGRSIAASMRDATCRVG